MGVVVVSTDWVSGLFCLARERRCLLPGKGDMILLPGKGGMLPGKGGMLPGKGGMLPGKGERVFLAFLFLFWCRLSAALMNVYCDLSFVHSIVS